MSRTETKTQLVTYINLVKTRLSELKAEVEESNQSLSGGKSFVIGLFLHFCC